MYINKNNNNTTLDMTVMQIIRKHPLRESVSKNQSSSTRSYAASANVFIVVYMYMLPENSEVRKFMYCLTRSGNSWIACHRQEIHEFPKMARKFMNFLKLRLSHYTIFLKGNVAIVWLESQCETSAFVFTHQLKSGPCKYTSRRSCTHLIIKIL